MRNTSLRVGLAAVQAKLKVDKDKDLLPQCLEGIVVKLQQVLSLWM